MIALSRAAQERFIRDNTALLAPPHVPEIRLLLADEAHELWTRTEEELQQIGLPPPYWAFAWAGGQGLARHVLDHPDCVKGLRVLDLASGSGIVAIAAAMAGAASVVANDIDSLSGVAIELNARANGMPIVFDPRDLLADDPPIGGEDGFDVVLAGDVFYDRAMTERLVPWFARAVAAGATVLAGDPGRHYRPTDRLEALAEYRVPVTRALEDSEVKHTIVWRFR